MITLDLGSYVAAVKDCVSDRLSDYDARTICLRSIRDYDPMVLKRLICEKNKQNIPFSI